MAAAAVAASRPLILPVFSSPSVISITILLFESLISRSRLMAALMPDPMAVPSSGTVSVVKRSRFSSRNAWFKVGGLAMYALPEKAIRPIRSLGLPLMNSSNTSLLTSSLFASRPIRLKSSASMLSDKSMDNTISIPLARMRCLPSPHCGLARVRMKPIRASQRNNQRNLPAR